MRRFFYSTTNDIRFKRYHLEEGETEPTFSIFEKFRSQGVTDYVVSFHPYGREGRYLWAELPSVVPGVVSAFSTRRFGGFSDQELAYLEALTGPLAMCVKASTTHELAQTVLKHLFGKLLRKPGVGRSSGTWRRQAYRLCALVF